MRLVKANEATASRRRVFFHLVDATDGITAETGEAGGQPQVSSDGGAWTNTGIGTLTAVGNGRYYADLTQTLVASAGTQVETRYKSANTAECPGDSVQVVAYDPYDATALGISRIDAAISSRMATFTLPTNFSSLAITGVGAVTVGTNNDKTGYALSSSQTFDMIGNITGNLSGSVGSVSGDVSGKVLGGGASSITGDGVRASSVTGSVGSVTGAVGSVTAAVTVGTINNNVITAASIAQDAIDADAIAASAVTEIQSGLSTLTSVQVENALWDAQLTSHTTAGSYGARVVRSTNTNNEVMITGSNHVAADIHEVQPAVFSDADWIAGSTYLKLSTLIEADTPTGYRYTAQALEQAPTGGGGGGSTTVRMGPFVIKADGGGADQPLDLQQGANHAIDCTLIDGTGTGVDLTGATLTAQVYDDAGTLVESPAGTASYAALGLMRWTITTTTTNTAGTYTVTITRTTGASDTQIFGPLRLYVREV